MKKKLLAIIAVLIAFVMSFSLIACGNKSGNGGGGNTPPGGDPPGGGETPTLTATKLETALGNLTNAGTIELNISGVTTSKENTKGDNFNVKVTASGDVIKVVDGDATEIINLGTGYVYTADEDGKYTVSMTGVNYADYGEYGVQSVGLPTGMLGYIVDVLDEMLGDVESGDVDYSEIVELFSYDKDYAGFVTNIEAKDEVNSALEFVQGLYADDASALDVMDAVLAQAFGSDITVEALLQFAVSNEGYGLIKNISIYSVVKMVAGDDADDLFDNIFAMLDEVMGLELDEESQAAIKDRTIGEMLAGVMTVLPKLMEGGIEEINPMELVYSMFFEEVTEEDVDAVADVVAEFIPMIVDTLESIKIKAYIDTANPDMKAMIATKDFAFNTISAKIGFKMTDSDITEVKIDGLVKHNYNGETKDLHFLRNNDYAVTVTVGINAKSAATDFLSGIEFAEHPFGEEEQISSYHVRVLAKAYTDSDIEIYFETAGFDIKVIDMVAYYYDEEYDEQTITASYDAATNKLKIAKDQVAVVLDSAAYERIYVDFVVVGDEFEDVNVSVTIMLAADTSLDTLLGFIL